MERLTQELIKEPCGSHGCLFVVAKGIPSKDFFDVDKRDAYDYEVLGGTHLMLATKQLNERFPDNKHFAGRMARIYCGLTDEQVIHLGAMHQKSSSYCHDITYREEVIIYYSDDNLRENYCIYWIDHHGHLLKFWTLRVGACSRLGTY